MTDLSRKQIRDDKIARTLIRLKHSLNADDDIFDYRKAVRDAQLNGESLELSPDLLDFDREV